MGERLLSGDELAPTGEVDALTRMRIERAARHALELGDEPGAPEQPPTEDGPDDANVVEVADGGERTEVEDPRTLAAVLQAAPDGVVLFDGFGKIADWSPAAERILGYSRDRAVGRDVLKLLFPERLRAAMHGVIESRGMGWGDAAHRSIEVSLMHSSGEEIPIELSLSWASGSGLFACHLRDGRERSERERRLASEARRRARLLELGQIALTADGLGRLMEKTLEVASEEIGFTSAEIWEHEEDGGELLLRSSRGDGGTPGARLKPAPGSQIGEAMRRNAATVVSGDKLLPSPWLAPGELREGTPSGIAAILSGVERVLGVLSGSTYPGGSFSTADAAFLESIALILASAIERDRFNQSLATAESRLRGMVERLPAITYRAGLGSTGRWYYISPQVEEILGYSPEECLVDHYWWERLVHPDDLQRVLAEEERVGREGVELDIEYRMKSRDGRTLWVRDRASIGHRDERDDSVVVEGLISDITAQKEAEERLRHLADHDHLTDLLNRRGFEAAVDRWLADAPGGSRGALAIIDLDHLKMVNDSLGHAVGDALLREIAAAIRVSLRGDDIFGRLSGDEFALFVPGIDEGTAKRRFGELIELIRESGKTGPQITASAGVIVVHSDDSLRAADLLVHADLALYQAKEGGRDRVSFSDETENERIRWVGEIREAIEGERLALYAQPIIDLGTGRQHAYELLVRMLDRDGNAVPANQFIPTAERFGLIRQVDHWVVAQAVEIAASGHRVCVNISAASISDAELTDLVAARLEEHGDVDPGLITFEITETVATPTIEVLHEFADRVERIGCGLSLDDVGTGFGTLTYLQNLRFSQLKIDMAFVQGILDSPTDAGIVRSLVVIARNLGLTTVAEGVECFEVVNELRALGVDHAQGYFLGEPTRIDTLLAP